MFDRFASTACPVAVAILCAGSLFAGDVPLELVTDRPDQTESAVVVPRGYVQLETGWTHVESESSNIGREFDRIPETLVRIGLSRIVELRVGFAGYVREETQGTSVDGFGDSFVGMKVGLAEERGRRPQLALLASTSLPTGDAEFSSARADQAFRFSMSNTLTDRLSFGYNVGVAWASREDTRGERDTLSAFIWTATLGIGATDRLGFFVELFGETGLSADGSPANSLDGGLTFLVKDDFQLDLFVGAGLTDAAADWFGGIGLSYRFG